MSPQKSTFFSVERGRFVFWGTVIHSPSALEWQDRADVTRYQPEGRAPRPTSWLIPSLIRGLKGTNMQHSGQMNQNIQTEKAIEIQPVRPTEACGKV